MHGQGPWPCIHGPWMHGHDRGLHPRSWPCIQDSWPASKVPGCTATRGRASLSLKNSLQKEKDRACIQGPWPCIHPRPCIPIYGRASTNRAPGPVLKKFFLEPTSFITPRGRASKVRGRASTCGPGRAWPCLFLDARP
jgi:hypothetical protein